MQVGQLASPAVARIDVNDPRAPLLGLHHPPEPNRVRLGHVPALDHDDVRVLEVLLEIRGATPANADPRPGTVELCHIRAWFSI